jgi:hypothetical protein
MKKAGAFIAALLILMQVSIPAFAQSCDPAIRTALQNHAEAMRARDKAAVMQGLPRNDPSLGMGCFEKVFPEMHSNARPGFW